MAYPYFPMGYPYQMPQYQAQQQSNGIIWVQGIEAMKSYPVSAGQSVLLMDSESNCFGIKSADASGMPHPLRVFDYTERKGVLKAPETAPAASFDVSAFITREEFERRIAALSTPEPTQKKSAKKDGENNAE